MKLLFCASLITCILILPGCTGPAMVTPTNGSVTVLGGGDKSGCP